jgi:ABC-type transporter Mla subunit MlaD
MPEPGELVTTTRVFGFDSIIQMLGSLISVVEGLRREVRDSVTSLEQFKADANAALDNIASGVDDIVRRLNEALADVQGQIDAAKAEQLSAIVSDLQPLGDRLRSVAEATPDAETPPPDNP